MQNLQVRSDPSVPAGVCVVDPAGMTATFNPDIARYCGMGPELLVFCDALPEGTSGPVAFDEESARMHSDLGYAESGAKPVWRIVADLQAQFPFLCDDSWSPPYS